jgi:DNA-binding CsgD family transcriptional regulator
MKMGGDQELIAALRTPTGDAWGGLGLYREPDAPLFDREELELIRSLAPCLAEGARRALLVGEAPDPEGRESPGLVVLTETWNVESATPGVEPRLSELPDGDWDAGRLPAAGYAVTGRALRTADGPDIPGEVAVARLLSWSGAWVVPHGAALVADGARRVAVIVEPAHPARISPLLMSAYGLSHREQEVTRLVLQGESPAQVAERLVVSPHTVQQHLKRVFEKTGVRSRRDLVGKVFFTHYEPRVRERATYGGQSAAARLSLPRLIGAQARSTTRRVLDEIHRWCQSAAFKSCGPSVRWTWRLAERGNRPRPFTGTGIYAALSGLNALIAPSAARTSARRSRSHLRGSAR